MSTEQAVAKILEHLLTTNVMLGVIAGLLLVLPWRLR